MRYHCHGRTVDVVRETDDAVYVMDDWDYKVNEEYEARKANGTLRSYDRKRSPSKNMKYLCIGGPLHGQRLATIQMPSTPDAKYYDFNQAGGVHKHLKMVRIHTSLLGLDDVSS